MKPRLLELYCKAGGAAMGYHRAGFEVVGVDVKPQPRYPFEFVQADALNVLRIFHTWRALRGWSFSAIHASPPCQAFTAYRRTGKVKASPDLIGPTRELLEATGLPYVIENVAGAPLRDWRMLCGSMFEGRGTKDIQRHRYFETNWPYWPPQTKCQHWRWEPDRYPGGRSKGRTGSNRGLVRATIEIGTWDIPLKAQQKAMGIDWMTLEELSEAIPPAYTEHIGNQLLEHTVALFDNTLKHHREPE